MKKTQLNSAFDALTPSEVQKQRMLENILQAAPIERKHKNFVYIAAPVCASLVLCVALVAFTLTRGGNQPALPSDALAEVGNSTSSGAPSTHDSDPSGEVHNSTATSKPDATDSAIVPSVSSKTPFESSSETQFVPSISPKPTVSSERPETSEPPESSEPPENSEPPESSEPTVPPEMPENPYDFSDISVDYAHVTIIWDEQYQPKPPVSSEPDDSKGPGSILGGDDVTPGDAPPTDDLPIGPDCDLNSSSLWLGDRRYTVPTDEYLQEMLTYIGEDQITAAIAVAPTGETVYRVGDTDDLLAVRDPRGTWLYFCFDGIAFEAGGRDTLAVYGAVSPDEIESVHIRYETDECICSYDFVARAPIAALYDSLYFAPSVGVEVSASAELTNLVIYLTNGRVISMRYDAENGLLIHGASIFDAGENTPLCEAIRTLLNVE